MNINVAVAMKILKSSFLGIRKLSVPNAVQKMLKRSFPSFVPAAQKNLWLAPHQAVHHAAKPLAVHVGNEG